MTTTPAQLASLFPELSGLSGARFLVKYGGAAMEREDVRESVCAEVAALAQIGITTIIVHGGGKEISRLLERLGLTPRFIDGLRVTDEQTMWATEMVLSGSVNKDLVSRITRHGASAVGISGRDARTLEASKLLSSRGEDLGHTGDVSQVRSDAIEALLSAKLVPVVSPVGETTAGAPLNLNADYAAAALAGVLRVQSCIFLTDVAGVKRDGAVLPRLTADEIHSLIADGTISGGMIPKVQCAVRAVQQGAPQAVICDASSAHVLTRAILGLSDVGTRVVAHERSHAK